MFIMLIGKGLKQTAALDSKAVYLGRFIWLAVFRTSLEYCFS